MQKMKSERKHLKSTEMANQRRRCDFWRGRSSSNRPFLMALEGQRSPIMSRNRMPRAFVILSSESIVIARSARSTWLM
jgi:hypothetical protein